MSNKGKVYVKKPFFDEVDARVSFYKLEEVTLKYWKEEKIVEKYLSKNKASHKYFSFLDGPITANNPMGVHHAWGRTYKDIWQRYKNMCGYKQRFQNGFDCQGLWVEVEVEKELGVKSKTDIENLVEGDKNASIEKFVDHCKERVFKYAKILTQQSQRLGYFMDWDNSYFTLSDGNNYMIWYFLKVCHGHGWIYKGKESVPWCPRCETAISQHEVLTEDYKEVTHKSVFFELPIVGRKKEYLIVWTTTPWTLPANIAVAVDKKMEYCLVKGRDGNRFWVAKDAVENVFGKDKGETIKTVKGSELVGLRYKGPFDHLPAVAKVAKENPKTFHTVIETDDRIMPISSQEGTGLVHTAVSAGTEDFKLGKKLGLPMIPVIADDASYIENLGFLSGKNAKDHPELILNYLVDEDKKDGVDWVFNIQDYTHRYPRCWRCKTELVWKVTDEWYIAMDVPSTKDKKDKRTLRKRMIDVAKSIEWIPGFGLDREVDWLSNMNDWLISKKNRYWGLALPIWECSQCGNFMIIGSKEELKEKAADGWEDFQDKSPHKPQIDKVKLKCEKCNEIVSRVEPVGNPWLDAGIVAYSTISNDNKAANPKYDDTPLYLKDKKAWRKWFPASMITESFPGQFKNWFYSLIAMSTVLEDEKPTDVVLGHENVWAEDGRPMHKSWGNAIEFNEGAKNIGVDVMRFIIAKQNPTEKLLFGYTTADETRRRFHLKLWNVYNFFLTYANIDEWKPISSDQEPEGDPKNILDKWIMSRLSQVAKSVSKALNNFDSPSAVNNIEVFLDDLSNWYIRRSRSRVGPMVQSNEDKADFYQTIYFVLKTLSKLLAPFTPFLSENIYTNLTKEDSVHLSDWPNIKFKVDIKLIEQMSVAREVVEKVHSERKSLQIPVRQPLASFSTNINELQDDLITLIKDEVNIKDIVWSKLDGKDLVVELDTHLTLELKEEAKTRELIRKVQNERKKNGMSLIDKITVKNPWIPTDKSLLKRLKNSTLAISAEKGNFKIVKVSS